MLKKVTSFGVVSGVRVKSIMRMLNAEWLEKLLTESNYQKQDHLIITKEMVLNQSKKIPNWKAPGKNGVQGF